MKAHLIVHRKKLKDVISAQTCILFFSRSVFFPLLCDFASLTTGKKKAERNGVREVRQGRTDGCFAAAPGLVFHFR